jgi:hypothetical protein
MTLETWLIANSKYFLIILKIEIVFSVLGNLDPYSGTWTRTRELPVLVYVLRFPSTGHTKKHSNVLILISKVTIDAWLFCHV